MKPFRFYAAVLLTSACLGACATSSPTAPSAKRPDEEAHPLTATVVPTDAGMCETHFPTSATMADGSVWWVCETKPRQYCTASGKCDMEIDHYIQKEDCPTVPID